MVADDSAPGKHSSEVVSKGVLVFSDLKDKQNTSFHS